MKTAGRGRTVDEWSLRPGRDNHWFDGVVGCAVGASILGAVLPGTQTPKSQTERKPMTLRAMYAAAQRSGG